MKTIDLNEMENTPTQTNNGFDDQFFDQLPVVLRDGCSVLTDATERTVFFLGALGVLGGVLQNVNGVYDGAKVSPNIYIFVLGRYGGGKGALRYARRLGETIHQHKTQQTQTLVDEFENARPVPQQLFYVPANNSRTGFFENLNTNGGGGVLFETEGDTLTDTLNQEFGKFSDGLRKAFHHENISFYRRLNREFVEIENPRLSVVLSGTTDQLQRLIPSAQNGLFSRFCYFELPENEHFKNVFDPAKNQYEHVFDHLAQTCFEIFDFLNLRSDNPYNFELTTDQQAQFLEFFSDLKKRTRVDITSDLDGLIHRLGLQFFRIAMILTTLRHFGANGLRRPMVCCDLDFELTKQIIERLQKTAINVYLQLPEPPRNHSILEKAQNVERALELHASGQSFGEIAKTIFGAETKKSTIYRWING